MRQYRKDPENLKREREKLERERYRKKHPDTTQQTVVTVVYSSSQKSSTACLRPPSSRPICLKSLSLERRDYEEKKKSKTKIN